MDNLAIPAGVEFLNKIGNFVFRDNKTGAVMFVGEYNASYDIAITTQSQDTKGGAGNALLMRTYSDRMVEITLVAKEWQLPYIAANTGSVIKYGLRDVFVMADSLNVVAGKAKLNQKAIGKVFVELENGASFEVSPNGDNEIDITSFGVEDACVKTTYQYSAKTQSVIISADGTPMIGGLALQGKVSSSRLGEVAVVEVDIPSFAISGNINITMNADGSTQDMQLSGVALATSGDFCGVGMTYGIVKEIRYDDVAPMVTEIIPSPDPIELVVGDTQTISILGNVGGMYERIGVLNSECTFTIPADDLGIATVSADGVVTGVGEGETEVAIAYTATGVSDTLQVIVSAA